VAKIIGWLRDKAPGFDQLSDDELEAISDFSLLWSLFEARILNFSGSARAICRAVDDWRASGVFDAEVLNEELAGFRQHYFANGDFTHHFDHLHLRDNDFEQVVRAVIDGTDNDPRDRVVAILIIVFRFRNNLFHGVKWQYNLAGQKANFAIANATLVKVLERYGALADG
tara:strand:+ start:7737 stop:8246 length:510 start_codon:yes stop_codon:yes gene_type:complete